MISIFRGKPGFQMHFSLRFGIVSYSFDFFRRTQNCVPNDANMALEIRKLKFHTPHTSFHKIANILTQWDSDPDCALATEKIGCQCEIFIHFIHGGDELEHCRQATCIPIPGKDELFLPRYGCSPPNCIFRVLWWGAPSNRKLWHPRSEVTGNPWRMITYSGGVYLSSADPNPRIVAA